MTQFHSRVDVIAKPSHLFHDRFLFCGTVWAVNLSSLFSYCPHGYPFEVYGYAKGCPGDK